jgi:hypothetical protein
MFRILRIDSRFRGNDREEDGNDSNVGARCIVPTGEIR